MNILGILCAVIVFLLLVIIHEAGHFFAAKLCGVHVEEFSIGMGPLIFKKQTEDTQYSLRAVPVGGYCKLESEFAEDGEDKEPGPRAFSNAPWWKKVIILFAGAFNNMVLCIIILFFVFVRIGSYSSVLDSVTSGGPADIAGIRAGDEIVAIDGTYYDSWNAVVNAINDAESPMDVTYIRDGEEFTVSCDSIYNAEADRNIIGITCSVVHSPGLAIKSTFSTCVQFYEDLFGFFGSLFGGNASDVEVSGVVGIVSMVSTEMQFGLVNVFYIMGILSLNLGAVNLLPFPALDGGRILMVLLRVITKDKIGDKAERVVNTIGMVILMTLMIALIFKDTIALILK